MTSHRVRPPMPLYYHDLYTDGIDPSARFPRERYRRLKARLERSDDAHLVSIREAPETSRAALLRAHEPGFVDRFLAGELGHKERRRIGLRPWTPLLIPRTLRIVGGALAALHDVTRDGGVAANMAGGTHHAHHDWGSGYCVFNDLAVCARVAVQRLDYRRVLVLDLDVHQGDGTATILSGDAHVRTVSLHCEKNFPFRKAESSWDIGLPQATDDEGYHRALDAVLTDAVDYAPDLVLFQAGVDGLAADALGRLALSREGMSRRNERVLRLCHTRGTPCVVFMGGGYSNPIEPTLDAFEDLFASAARAHQRYANRR